MKTPRLFQCKICGVTDDPTTGFKVKRYSRQANCSSCDDTRRRLAKYSLTFRHYEKLLEKQHGTCGICKMPFVTTPAIDHSHTTGVVRGLLCNSCNSILGFSKENQVTLLNAVLYLKETEA